MVGVHVGVAGLALLALAWLAGTALQLQQPELRGPAFAAAAGGAGLLLCVAAWGLWRRAAAAWARAAVLVLAALGVALGAWVLAETRAQWRLAASLDPALEGRDLVVTGTVAELPRLSLQGTRFVFEVASARWAAPAATPGQGAAAVRVPGRLSLAWFHGFDGEALLSRPPQALIVGDRWELTVRLKRPHGPMNPQGFDLERWMFEQDLRATGHVRPGARFLGPSAAHPVERLRQRIRDAILLRVDDAGAAGVVAALAVGDQAAIARDDWEVFRVTGVAHLMSISGLHVTMFAWLAAAIVGAAWRRSARLSLAWPAPTAARWGGLALATGYALLAGFGVPAQRTVLMLAVVVVLRAGALRWPAPLVLLAAAVAVTLLEPWALLQPGFWLSFAAVGLLMLSVPASARDEPAGSAPEASWVHRLGIQVRAGLRTQVVATLGLAPLTLVFFQQVSLVGFAANLLAIPWVTLVVTPLALLGVLLPPLWALAGLAVAGMNTVLAPLAQAPLAQWTAAAAPGWAMAAGLAGGALLVLPLPWRLRLLGLPLVLPLLAPPLARPPPGAFEVVAVDVGQGTSVLVRTRGHLLVYDAGPRYAGDSDAGERIVLPLLRARDERAIDLLVLSHRDTDHVGGAQALLDALPVRGLMSSLEPGHPLLQTFRPAPDARDGEGAGARAAPQPCVAGQRWSWDGVAFEVLHPLPAAEPVAAGVRPNARSCVLQVRAADGRSLLLTGDIEAAQEAELLARAGPSLRSEVLVVPHHGSRTSSTPAFVETVAPRVAVVQAAYRSRFGHPVPEVVGRYEAQGATLVRSDRCGAWGWASHTGADTGTCEREHRRRYWHTRIVP
jgi:competence protein ComEC